MNRTLTAKMKVEYFPRLIRRDGGFKCFYDGKDLVGRDWIYEHLDDNPAHSQIENIVLACQSCNKKKQENYDMKFLALEKKRHNEESMFTCERDNLEASAPTLAPEMDANQQNFEIAQQYLTEVVQTDGFIEFKDALDSITMECKKKTSFGSQVSVRRYLDALVSRAGPFMIIKNEEKKRIIVMRTGA